MNSLELLFGNAQFGSKSAIFVPCGLELWQMTLNNNKVPLLYYIMLCASFQSHGWIQTGVTVRKQPIQGQNRRFFVPWDPEIWRMTLKNNRQLSSPTSSFRHNFIAISEFDETRLTVQKRLNCGLTSVTLIFDLWPWTFAWTSLLSLVMAPENFMMIRLWSDGQTDRWTEPFIELLGRS